MRKAQLLSTVAAALLLTAGATYAQGTKDPSTPPERAPAAQQNAPAEKVAPPMKKGADSGAMKHETTGQAPSTDKGAASPASKSGDKSSNEMNKSSDDAKDMKKGSENSAKPETKSEIKSEMKSEKTDANSNAAASSKSTTGQGAAAGQAKLSSEQRTKISAAFKQHRVAPAKLNISIRVGARVPTNVHFYPVPAEVVTIYPEWRGYDYILVGDEILIISPRTHEIIAVLEA